MHALVYRGAWQMPLEEVPEPHAGPGEVVVEVKAVGICGSDVHGFTGVTGRRKPPIIMGHELSGAVNAVGQGVGRWREGDRVIVSPLQTCGACENCKRGLPNLCRERHGLGVDIDGAYAERLKVKADMLHPMPEGMTWEMGAMAEPLSVAMHAVELSPIHLLDTVAIVGAGTIGLLTLVAARMKGAGRIVITDLSEHRLRVARSLGGVAVNVKEEDPAAVVRNMTEGQGAAVVFEAVGTTATVQQALALVRAGGTVVWVGNSHPMVELNMQQVVTRELTIRGSYGFNQEFPRAINALAQGHVDVGSLVERTAPLADGPTWVRSLAEGKVEDIKVILHP